MLTNGLAGNKTTGTTESPRARLDGETWYSADYYLAPRTEGGGR